MTGGKPISVLSQSISGVCAFNLLAGILRHSWKKKELLFYYFVPDTTRDYYYSFHLVTQLL
jgi:hypothetical protein